MNPKTIHLASGGEEGAAWTLPISVREATTNFSGSFQLREKKTGERRRKAEIRWGDSKWVIYNIPSSIWWYNQIHHDWEDGARMYLLTKEEHKRRTRDERHKKGT